MYFNYIYQFDNFHINGFLPSDKVQVTIPLTMELLNNKKVCLQKLNSNDFTFCFSIPGVVSKKAWLQAKDVVQISTFFFLPNYIKKGGSYLLTAPDRQLVDSSLYDNIKQALLTQGVNPLSINLLNEDNANNSNEYCCYIDAWEYSEQRDGTRYRGLLHKIMEKEAAGKMIVVPVKDSMDYEKKKQNISKFENWLKENDSELMKIFLAYKGVLEKQLQLQTENTKLRFRLNNFEDYVKLLRETARWHVHEYHRIHNEIQFNTQRFQEKGAGVDNLSSAASYHLSELQKELEYLKSNRDNILEWYKKEYEVLPVWYKKFGHIIKVMTGKRSVKSLYK